MMQNIQKKSNDLIYPYGTSGFRFNENTMLGIAEKIGQGIGAVIVLLNYHSFYSKHLGVMVTASHNVYTDNGIKLIDDRGSMVSPEIETLVQGIVNDTITIDDVFKDLLCLSLPSHNAPKNDIQKRISKYDIDKDLISGSGPGLESIEQKNVYMIFGNDTRRSGDVLKIKIFLGIEHFIKDFNSKNCFNGSGHGTRTNIEMIKVRMLDIGFRTTPEVHTCVMRYNKNTETINQMYSNDQDPLTLGPLNHGTDDNTGTDDVESVEGMDDISDPESMIQGEYGSLTQDLDQTSDTNTMVYSTYYIRYVRQLVEQYNLNLNHIVVDCANGVGFITLSRIFSLDRRFSVYQCKAPVLINTEIHEHQKLNDKCGSDYIMNSSADHHKMLLSVLDPKSFDTMFRENILHASFDGDADRLIFYFYDRQKINIISGDHISFLVLYHIINSLTKIVPGAPPGPVVTIGVIHTGYTNSGFTDAVNKIALEIRSISPYIDVHRSMVPTGVKNLIEGAKKYDIGIYFESNGHGSVLINNHHGINELMVLQTLFNPLIGDALMNLMGLTYILKSSGLRAPDMLNMFKEKESRTLKVHVKDKNIYKVSYDQTKLLEPLNIVFAIDTLLNEERFKGCRAFVRPSGTEDVLRLYVENNELNSVNLDDLVETMKKIL